MTQVETFNIVAYAMILHYITFMTQDTFATIINLVRAHALIQSRLAGELASIHGLALNEALLLMHLEGAPLRRLTRIDLARRLHLNPSTVTRMATPLEKIGLVDRQADPRDARLAYMSLTRKGAEIIREARATIDSRSADFFRDRWSEAEIAQLRNLLGRLTAGETGDLVS